MQPEPYDFGAPDTAEWFVNKIVAHRWTEKSSLEFHVQWSLGNTMWEPLLHCRDLAALDRYLKVIGVKSPCLLPKKLATMGNKVARPACAKNRCQKGKH